MPVIVENMKQVLASGEVQRLVTGSDVIAAMSSGSELLASSYSTRVLLHVGRQVQLQMEAAGTDPVISSFQVAPHTAQMATWGNAAVKMTVSVERMRSARGIYMLISYNYGGVVHCYYVGRACHKRDGMWARFLGHGKAGYDQVYNNVHQELGVYPALWADDTYVVGVLLVEVDDTVAIGGQVPVVEEGSGEGPVLQESFLKVSVVLLATTSRWYDLIAHTMHRPMQRSGYWKPHASSLWMPLSRGPTRASP